MDFKQTIILINILHRSPTSNICIRMLLNTLTDLQLRVNVIIDLQGQLIYSWDPFQGCTREGIKEWQD